MNTNRSMLVKAFSFLCAVHFCLAMAGAGDVDRSKGGAPGSIPALRLPKVERSKDFVARIKSRPDFKPQMKEARVILFLPV